MILVELTEVPDAALPVARLKEHLRLGTGFADDAVQDGLLTGFLRAALAAVEARTGKALLRRNFRMTVQDWLRPARQPLPVAPVTALAGVTLVDADGTAVPVAVGSLRVEPDALVPSLVPLGALLPPIPPSGVARVDFTAGFGPAWSDLPPDLAQAALMLAGHYHEFRADTGLDGACMPFGVTALIERYRPLRLSGGSNEDRRPAPRLSRRLALEAPVLAPDGAGGYSRAWQVLGLLYAEVAPGASRLDARPAGIERRTSLRITVRGAPPGSPRRPVPGQRFREGERLYAIDSVAEADALGRFLTCAAREETLL